MSSLQGQSEHLVAAQIRERHFQKNEVLQQEGRLSTHLAVTKVGMIQGFRRGMDGEHRTVGLARRGQLIGTLGLLGQPNELGVVAMTSGRLCEISNAELHLLGVIDHQVMTYIHHAMAASIGHLADWSQVMRVKGLQKQLLTALHLIAREQQSLVIQLPSHVALAALLATTRESIARNLTLLEQQGQLQRQERRRCLLIAQNSPPQS